MLSLIRSMTNAELEVIEVVFNRPLSCGTQAMYPDFSASAIVINPQFRKTIASKPHSNQSSMLMN
jgi:hypothetical protein